MSTEKVLYKEQTVYVLFQAALPVALTYSVAVAAHWETKGRLYGKQAYTVGEFDEKILADKEVHFLAPKGARREP